MDEGCMELFTCWPTDLNISSIRSIFIPPVVEPAIPQGTVISTVIRQAKSGQVLLSDIANPVVDIELTT